MDHTGEVDAVTTFLPGGQEAAFALYILAADPSSPYGGQVVMVSPSFAELTGVSTPDQYASWFENIHPVDRPSMLATNRRAWEQGTGYDLEVRFHRQSNTKTDSECWTWVRLIAHSVPGDPVSFQGLAVDVSAQKEAQLALQQVNQMLEERVAERTRELKAMYDVATVASASVDLDVVMSSSLSHTLAVMDCQVGAIHLLDEEKGLLYPAASHGLPSQVASALKPVSVERGLLGRVVESGEPLVVPRIAGAERPLMAIPTTGNQVYVGAPMRVRGQILGVLSLVGEPGKVFGDREVSLLSLIADQVGIAVESTRLYRQSEQLAVMRERQRLARELHDSAAQALYSLTLLAEAGRRLVDAGEVARAREALVRLGEIGHQALKETRLLVYELRPLALHKEGLVRALRHRLDTVERRAGIQADLVAEGTIDLPDVQEEALYRIAQEALNNALKHAAASSVTVRLVCCGGEQPVDAAQACASSRQVVLEVVDDGRGFDPEAASVWGGIGLTSMWERAEKLGGTFTISSAPGEGTRVTVRLGGAGPAAADSSATDHPAAAATG